MQSPLIDTLCLVFQENSVAFKAFVRLCMASPQDIVRLRKWGRLGRKKNRVYLGSHTLLRVPVKGCNQKIGQIMTERTGVNR